MRYILHWFGWLIGKIGGLVFAPFVALFAGRDGWLPDWLSWWQTPDNPIDGDSGWKTEHWQWRFKLPGWLATYVGRVGWLWRNTAYGWGHDVIGAKCLPGDVVVWFGDSRIGNRPGYPGMTLTYLYRNGKLRYWQFYFVLPWHKSGRCLRMNHGWKLWHLRNKADDGVAVLAEAHNAQFVFSPNPVMGYEIRKEPQSA